MAESLDESHAYAAVLDWGTRLGLGVLLITFVIYVTDLLPLRITHEALPRYWGLPVRDYLQAMQMSAGWAWLHHLGNGDVLALLGVAFLAGITLAAYLPLLVGFTRKRDWMNAVICVAEVGVLALAASGVLQGGGH